VTSVARRAEPLSETPAAIDVLTQADLVASGVTTLPDALRLAPGVHVAQVDANKWAVGIRGFTSRLARAQLVLIDGRSVYNNLFAGTYWEVQDTLLEDVDRIEVVRGPGGTLWGANAANGVVNVITRSAHDTQGGFATAGAGNEERAFFGARYGGTLGERGGYRVYGKFFDRDGGFHKDGVEFDDWRVGQGGFRTDFELAKDTRLSLQGDAYAGRIGQRTSVSAYQQPYISVVTGKAPVSGGNLLGRYTRARDGSSLQLTGYYDRSKREEPTFRETRDTFDLDVQHALQLGASNHLTWGVGLRASIGDSSGVETVAFVPPKKTDTLASAFLQDELALFARALRVTFGTKVEHNDYSGVEWQPSVRLLWRIADGHSAWAAATRAVRTPSRVEQDLAITAATSPTLPVFIRVTGDPAFRSEESLVFEAGYRARLGAHLSLDAAAFHNRYDDLLGFETGQPFSESGRQIVPLVLSNALAGRGSGLETSLDVRAGARLGLHLDYTLLSLDLHAKPGSSDTTSAASAEGSSPRHRVTGRARLTLPEGVDVSAVLRWVDVLRSQAVPAYTQVDARLGWRATKRLELAAVGRNLLGRHLEFGGNSAAPVEIEPSLYGQLLWRW